MNKSTQILVGVGVVGLVLYLYLQNKKKLAMQQKLLCKKK